MRCSPPWSCAIPDPLIDDIYRHVEEAHALVGSRSGEAYRLGDAVLVRLVEAIPTGRGPATARWHLGHVPDYGRDQVPGT
jgi:hypothetical protein